MFFSAAHAVGKMYNRTIFTTLCKQARFLSVSNVSSMKNFYSESVLFSEKPRKSAKDVKYKGKMLEQSQLYPDGLEKLPNHEFMEEFNQLIDDETPLIQKDPVSGKQKNVGRKSKAVDKMLSMQEVQKSVQPKSVARKSEVVGESSSFEMEEFDLQENDLPEKLSDSNSDSDSDSESEAKDYHHIRNIPDNLKCNGDKLEIVKLYKEKDDLISREQMVKGISQSDGLVLNDDIGGMIILAKLGITPEALFFYHFESLKIFFDLSNVALYQVPYEDLIYWGQALKSRKAAMIGLYKKEDIKKCSLKPEMPLTLICDNLCHKLGFGQILNSVFTCPPKLFITSKDCIDPWNKAVFRYHNPHGLLLNHDFGLTWEEIQQKVDEKNRVYILELSMFPDAKAHWAPFPSLDLYNHNIWDAENIALILTFSRKGRKVSKELSSFLSERNASRIDPGLTNLSQGLSAFHMVYFELRRQWLAAESRNLSKSGSKNGNTARSRVRIVSTLFKT